MFGCSNLSASESEPAEDIARVAATEQSNGSITSNKTYGDFTLLATSKKNVKISSSSATYGSTSYKKAWDLQGGADGVKPSYRAFKVTLAKGDILKAVVNANASRTLQLSNGSKVVSSASVGTSASLFSYNATSAGTYYLYSKSSSIRVFEITKTGSSSSGSSSGSSGSSSDSSSSSSGSSSSLSISASKTQTGVGTRSRLNEISSIY